MRSRVLWLLLLLLSCVSVGDAAITSALVTPASLSAGVTGTVDVAFTTGAIVPVGGTIVVTFPSTFYVDSAAALTTAIGFDSGSTVVAVPATRVVTITIATMDAAAGAISFTLDSITNPGRMR
ncbi:unnamed protein product [Phytophthora lilii]|uniref:Unnamed protein product n=1 Tax=Phytophthora lilii TaxID=2077276 RepID=A0A9W6TD40_9STRA|nr:unnamed protein product [Phytophthora lilii]